CRLLPDGPSRSPRHVRGRRPQARRDLASELIEPALHDWIAKISEILSRYIRDVGSAWNVAVEDIEGGGPNYSDLIYHRILGILRALRQAVLSCCQHPYDAQQIDSMVQRLFEHLHAREKSSDGLSGHHVVHRRHKKVGASTEPINSGGRQPW